MMQVIQVITKWHFCKITNSKTMSWLSSLKKNLATLFCPWHNVHEIFHKTKFVSCYKSYCPSWTKCDMPHCHNTPCCPAIKLVLCCTSSMHAAQYSPKLLYVVCPSLHHNSPRIAPKWKRKIVGRKCQNSKQKQFKITYLVSPLNHSQRSTRGTVS